MRIYHLVEGSSPENLNMEVDRLLENGWDCWGNPFAMEAEFDANVIAVHFFQAVVKTDYDPREEARKLQKENGIINEQEIVGFAVGAPEMSALHSADTPDGGSTPPRGVPTYQNWRQLIDEIFEGFKKRTV